MSAASSPAGEPIDAVYTWVDAGDAEFQEQLRRYPDALRTVVRFHDPKVLRYSLRSLARYAPWIRKVYLVTNGQAPAWIRRGHPRLQLVRHEDIFKDRTALPVFNSRAIEWQLFRIPGLSRRFLYFHDDFFLAGISSPADFLTAKGGCRVLLEPHDISPADAASIAAERLLNSRFGDHSPRKMVARAPRLVDRTLLEEAHRLWEVQIRRTAANRFRNPEDVSMATLYSYYLLESPLQFGAHQQTVISPRGISARAGVCKQLISTIGKRPKWFYVEDENQPGEPARKRVRWFLRLYFWRRSSWERRVFRT